MSNAVLCQDEHLERHVVVKTLAPGTDSRRILDELAALQTIRSKHVVQVYDVICNASGNVDAIVEEYLPGDDLTAVSAPTNATEFLRLVYQVAEGIADVHAHEIVHRDIKRQNMKYDDEGCLKIFDFGLARGTSVDASTIGIIGTPGYLAPELFQTTVSGRVSFTTAVDTYAFGATALALAIGGLPPDLCAMPPKLPCIDANFANLPLELPAEIADVMNRCLAPEPSQRPDMVVVSRLIGLHLLRDRHRALLVSKQRTYVLDKDNLGVQLSVSGQGSLKISYDGLRFIVGDVNGNVAINNMAVSDGDALPDSCVIVLGSPELMWRRTMVTVDVSHPEVTI